MRKLLTVLLFSFIFISCSNEELNNVEVNNQPELRNIEFVYNGVKYSTTYFLTADSSLIYNDKEVQSIMDKIADLPEAAAVINEDGTLEFYDDRSGFPVFQKNEEVKNDPLSTRANNFYMEFGYIIFYINSNASGSRYQKNLTAIHSDDCFVVREAFNSEFADKISSIETTGRSASMATTFHLTLYQFSDFTGKSITMYIRPGASRLFNLGDYIYSGLFSTWSDKASSYTVWADYNSI